MQKGSRLAGGLAGCLGSQGRARPLRVCRRVRETQRCANLHTRTHGRAGAKPRAGTHVSRRQFIWRGGWREREGGPGKRSRRARGSMGKASPGGTGGGGGERRRLS